MKATWKLLCVTIHALHGFGHALPTHDSAVVTMKSVADYYLHHAPQKELKRCGWEHSAFMQGCMATFYATGDTKYLDHALWWGEENKWITCNYPKVLTEKAGANDMSCGQTYAELYMQAPTKNDTYIAHLRDKVLDVLIKRPQIDDWWWVDAYFMAMGTFARIGNITGGTSDFYDKCFSLYNDSATSRALWSQEHHLYFRDQTYQNKTTAHGKAVFWGRGVGWAAGALARTMQYVPRSHASFKVYSDHLQMMAATLKSVQPEDGMWRASVLDPTDPCCTNPETTGTSGITFGIAWGVNNGILDSAIFQPVVEKAWAGLSKLAVHESGLLGYCQPVGGGPQPAKQDSTSDFCVGLFLLAAEQVAKLSEKKASLWVV